jgi:hypothetical protein
MQRGRGIVRALGSGWVLLGIMTAIQLAQIPLALKFLSDEEFGLFAVLTQLMANLALIDLGVGVAVGRLMIDARVEGQQAVNTLWSSAACVFACQSTIVLLFTGLCAPFVPAMFSVPPHLVSECRLVFLVLGVMSACSSFSRLSSLSLFAAQRATAMNVIPAVCAVLQFLAFYAAARAGFRIWSLVIATAVSTFSSIALFRWLASRAGLVSGFRWAAVEMGTIAKVMKMAVELYVFGFVSTLIQNSLLVFGAFRLPLGLIAALTANAKLLQLCAQLLHRVPSSGEPYLMNLIARGDIPRFRFGWLFICRVTPVIAIIAGGMMHLFTAHFIRWWTGPEMILPASVIVWLAMTPLRQAIHYLLVNSLVMFKDVRAVRIPLLREAAIYALLAALLPAWWGITGLVLANLLSIFFGAMWAGSRRMCELAGIPARELVTALFRAVVPGLITGTILVLAVPNPAGVELTRLLAIGALWVAVSLAGLLFITLSHAERAHLLRSLGLAATKSGAV